MIRYEWKKMLIFRRGILLIGLYLIIKLISLLYFTEPYNAQIEKNRQGYDKYMAMMEGSLTDEKKTFMDEENVRLQLAVLELSDVQSDYFNGKLSAEEYKIQADLLREDIENRDGFQEVFSQFIYVREKPEERFLLYTNGWDGLLARDGVDYVLLILLVILLVPVFCDEYQSGMNVLQATERQSAVWLALCKILIAAVTAMILVLISCTMDLVYHWLEYGLPHGEYTLQSLQSFGGTQKQLSLRSAYGLKVLLTVFGYTYAAVLLMLITSCIRKYAPSLAVGTAVLILPYLSVADSISFAKIPGPWGFIIGTIYFIGSQYRTDRYTSEQVLVYKEISWGMLGVLLAVSLCLIGGFIYVIWRQNTNWWVKKRKRGTSKLLLVLLLSAVLGGCQRDDGTGETEDIIYNSANFQVAQVGRYLFYPALGTGESGIYCEDAETGERWWLDRDALIEEHWEIAASVFKRGDLIYYIKYRDSYECWAPGTSGSDTMAIVEVDTKDFNERIIYEQSINWQDNYFFGLRRNYGGNGEAYLNNMFQAFLDDKYIYFTINTDLYRMNLQIGMVSHVLELPVASNVAYDGEAIYYVGSGYELIRYEIGDEESTIYSEIVTDKFWLAREGIYYLNKRDHNTLYLWDFETESGEKILDIPIVSFENSEKYIYFTDRENHWLYQMDKENRQVKLVLEQMLIVYPFENNAYFYGSYTVTEDGENYTVKVRINEKTLEVTEIE